MRKKKGKCNNPRRLFFQVDKIKLDSEREKAAHFEGGEGEAETDGGPNGERTITKVENIRNC